MSNLEYPALSCLTQYTCISPAYHQKNDMIFTWGETIFIQVSHSNLTNLMALDLTQVRKFLHWSLNPSDNHFPIEFPKNLALSHKKLALFHKKLALFPKKLAH